MAQKTTPKKKAAQRKKSASVRQWSNNELMKALTADHDGLERKLIAMDKKLDQLLKGPVVPAKGKEWVPEVDELVKFQLVKVGYPTGVGTVHKVAKTPATGRLYADVSFGDRDTFGPYWVDDLRPLLDTEIEAYEVSQEKGVLTWSDSCICDRAQREELIQLALDEGLIDPAHKDPLSSSRDSDVGIWVNGCGSDEIFIWYMAGSDKRGSISAPLFKKKLLNTISAKKIEEEQREKLEAEKERNRVPDFGDHVRLIAGREMPYVVLGRAINRPFDTWILWDTAVEGQTIFAERSEFTILTPLSPWT